MINILLYYHVSQAQQAKRLNTEFARIAYDGADISIHMADNTVQVPTQVLDEMDAFVLLYTSHLEKNENLYKIISYIEPRASLERFFVFLENVAGEKISFPAIFHTIRAQQHHVFPKPDKVNKSINRNQWQDDLLKDFKESLPKMTAPVKEEGISSKQSFFTRLKKAWKSPRTIMVVISLALVIILGKVAISLAPEFFASMQPQQILVGSAAKPPVMEPLWLNEDFALKTTRDWQETNKYKGINSFSIDLRNNHLNVNAESAVEHAIYYLESINQWPLDELQGLQVSFQLQPITDEGSQAKIAFQIQLVENTAFFFGCSAVPSVTEGALDCYIQEPDQKVVVSTPQSITLKEWHTLALQFAPETYAVRFFLDGDYFGQSAIPSVEHWQGRDFLASIQVELQNWQKGFFTIQCDDFLLARQE